MEKEKAFSISPFGISDSSYIPESNIDIGADEIEVAIKVLKPLYGYSISGALQILDSAKSILLECTPVHNCYKP